MKNADVVVLTITITILLLFFLALAGGCTSQKYTRAEFHENGDVKSFITFTNEELLMHSNIDGVYVIVDDQKRELIIGEINRRPDAESVRAITKGVVEGILGGLK